MKFSAIIRRAAMLSLAAGLTTGCKLIRHEKVILDTVITTDGTATNMASSRVVPIGVAWHPTILIQDGRWEPETMDNGLLLWPPSRMFKQINGDGTVTDYHDKVVKID